MLLYLAGLGVYTQVAGLWDDLPNFSQRIGDYVGDFVDLVAAYSHNTALYLRTSSVFTLRNIS